MASRCGAGKVARIFTISSIVLFTPVFPSCKIVALRYVAKEGNVGRNLTMFRGISFLFPHHGEVHRHHEFAAMVWRHPR